MTETPTDISDASRLSELRRQIMTAHESCEPPLISVREMITINAICNTRHLMTESQLVDSFTFMEHMLERVRGNSEGRR